MKSSLRVPVVIDVHARRRHVVKLRWFVARKRVGWDWVRGPALCIRAILGQGTAPRVTNAACRPGQIRAVATGAGDLPEVGPHDGCGLRGGQAARTNLTPPGHLSTR